MSLLSISNRFLINKRLAALTPILIIALFLPVLVLIVTTTRIFFHGKATDLDTLKSDFFKNDATAISILTGNNYSPQDSNLIVTVDNTQKMNTLSFEFKLLNAFKQLGFNNITNTQTVDEKMSTTALHRFQKKYSLPVVDYLDRPALIFLDNLLFSREQADKKSAQMFPPLSVFIPSPPNEPPNSHLAALLYDLFSRLPQQTFEQILTIDEFRESLLQTLGGNLGYMMDPGMTKILSISEMIEVVNNKGDFRSCDATYFRGENSAFGGTCIGQPNTLLTSGIQIGDDFTYMILIAHEFGHIQGGNLFLINGEMTNLNRAFGKISFDMTTTGPDPNGSNVLLRPDGNPNEFFTGYGRTYNYEDLAESYSAYMLQGNIFRERAKLNPYLNQKYEFLKNNIFEGKEYNTGSIASYLKWINANPGIPSWTADYMYSDFDWTWDYQYPIFTPTPTSTTKIGDVNNDGIVNIVDIGILIDNYNKNSSSYPKSDVNNDGIIDIIDIGILIDNYGK